MTRINKYIADCGVASRRGAEDLIRAGKVSVNGKTVTDLSTLISETDKVTVSGKPVICQPKKVYILLNKPAGVVTTCNDQFGRKTVLDLLHGISERVYPVGRLDYATEGLLILTNDGEFAKIVTHPSSGISKTYVAAVNKPLSQQQITQLRQGAGFNPPKHLKVTNLAVELAITEGRNRQVRKMFETVGLRVTHLKRISVGKLTLGDLKPGEWRYLQNDEVKSFANPGKK